MINSNCNNCNAVTRLPGLQPPLPSPRPILSCLPPCAALRLQPGRGAVPKLPSAMGNGEPSLNWLLPSQEFSTSRMKKRLRLWLTKLISLLVSVILVYMGKIKGFLFAVRHGEILMTDLGLL